MAEDKLKKQEAEELQDEQLDEVNGGGTMRDIHSVIRDIHSVKR